MVLSRRSMALSTKTWIIAAVACLLPAHAVCATAFLSYTGSLATPEDVFEVTFSLSSTQDIAIQTWGFGGGTNATSSLILPGGFDPFVGVFAG